MEKVLAHIMRQTYQKAACKTMYIIDIVAKNYNQLDFFGCPEVVKVPKSISGLNLTARMGD